MITIDVIHESHLGGFYRFQVKTGDRIVLLTQGVSSTDMDRVQEVLFSELAHIAKEAR